jgi:hypothetical protein
MSRLPRACCHNFREWVLLKIFPYQLIYRVDGDEIRVFAVAHVRRRPGHWRRRLR